MWETSYGAQQHALGCPHVGCMCRSVVSGLTTGGVLVGRS